MLKLAGLHDDDVVFDLGSGDGRIVLEAAKINKTVRGRGIEIDEKLVLESRKTAAAAGVGDRVQFLHQNAFDAELIGELRATFDAMTSESPDVLRGVVLAGAGPVFCAGADVEWMRSAIGMGSTRTSGMPPRSTRCSPRSTAVRCR